MSQFTPGPWNYVAHPEHLEIRTAYPSVNPLLAETWHADNARLMAAAPDLLGALVAVVAVADRKTVEFDRARAAIAKAVAP